MKKSIRLSAQIILKSASGKKMKDVKSVTTKNVSQIRPSRLTSAKAVGILKNAGFEVEASGTTLSINSSIALFERYFNAKVIQKTNKRREQFFEMHNLQIPDELKNLVDEVVLPLPPELF